MVNLVSTSKFSHKVQYLFIRPVNMAIELTTKYIILTRHLFIIKALIKKAKVMIHIELIHDHLNKPVAQLKKKILKFPRTMTIVMER